LIDRASEATNGEKFRRLWSGDTAGYDTPSQADQALCNLLAFWCQGDTSRMDGLFRQSGLMRAKWDERRGEQTYGQKTIAKSLKGRTEFYRLPVNPAGTEPVAGQREKGMEILFAYFW